MIEFDLASALNCRACDLGLAVLKAMGNVDTNAMWVAGNGVPNWFRCCLEDPWDDDACSATVKVKVEIDLREQRF